MDKTGAAVKRQQIFIAQYIGDAGVDPPFDFVGQAPVDQFLAKRHEFLAIDGRFFIR